LRRQPFESLLITNLGRACQRVVRNIEEYSPTQVIYFRQDDTGWNEKNDDYKKALDNFRLLATVQRYEKQERIRAVRLTSITDYAALFDGLADLIEENEQKFPIIYLDCTGLPKLASAAALQLAAMYNNVWPIYNRNSVTAKYDKERDTEYSGDRGYGPELLPFVRIDVEWKHNPQSNRYRVLTAGFSLAEKHRWDVKFNKADLLKAIQESGKEISGIALGKALGQLLDSGLILADLMNPESFSLTLPGYVLARRILGKHTPGI